MEVLLSDFIKKVKNIVNEEEKVKQLEKVGADLIIKCANIYELREGVILVNENKKIVEANEVLSHFNIDNESLVGKHFYDLIDEEFVGIIESFFYKLDSLGFNKKHNILLRNGAIVDIHAEVIHVDSKKYYVFSLKQKDINSVTYKLNVIEEQIANLIVRIKDFDSLMKEILSIFINSGLFDFGWVAKVDMDLKEIIPIVTLEEEEIDIEFKKQSFDFNYFRGILDMLLKDEDIIVKDVEFRNTYYKKSLIFPIHKRWDYKHESEIAYATLFYSEEDLHFGEEDLAYLREIIYKIDIAITDLFLKEQANLIVSTDTLTRLPKREIFVKEIKKLIKEKTPFAVAIIDIDKLRKVNEVLGFWAGDKAIKEFTKFLRENLIPNFIARVGSDEFGVIIKGSKEDMFISLERILKFNDSTIKINGSEVYLPVSVGVAFYPEDAKTEEELVILAEDALKMVKKRGGKSIGYANNKLTLLPKDYLEIERELREAIAKEEFVMYYQPIIDVQNNRVWGVEALIRWISPKRGLVPPGKFIPILEESGLINEVGDLIIDNVLLDAKEFEEHNLIFTFSMNISVIQLLSQDLAMKLIRRIKDFNVNKDQIVVEITETVLMENIDMILPQIKFLEYEGIKIEIDDFGTGYSSLSYLKQLPISALKIDMSFIKNILQDEENASIVNAIISMAKALKKKTIAEGVETKEIAEYLKKAGVDYLQGFYFAKPMPKEELKKYLTKF